MLARSPMPVRWVVLLSVVVMVAAACAPAAPVATPTPVPGTPAPGTPAPATPAPGTPAPGTPDPGADGGTLVAAWIGPCCLDVDTNNVLTAGGDYHWWNKIHGRLFTYTVANQQYDELVGELVDTWQVSDDGLTWTLNLRPNITWHDGEAFTARDVKFSFELCLDPAAGGCSVGGSLTPIEGAQAFQDGTADELAGVEIVNDLTLNITTSSPNAVLHDALAEVWILPEHSLGQVSRDQIANAPWWTSEQIGVGPFMWHEYVPGQSITLVRNENYWRGAPRLERIIRRQFRDVTAALLAFERGEIDITYVTADEVERLRASGVGEIFDGPSGVANFIQANPAKHPEFAVTEFRQALMHAIDRESIVEGIYGGAADIVPCLYGRPNLTGNVQPQAYDPDLARQLMAQANVTLKPEYVFDTYYNDALSINVMTAIQNNWREVLGLNVSILPMEGSAWVARYYDNGDSDLAFAGAANGPTGNRAVQYFHSASAWPGGGNGFQGYSYNSPQLDRLLEEAAAQFEPAEQDRIYQEACQLMRDELPWLVTWQTIRYWIVSNDLNNVILIPAPGGGSYYDAVETWTKNPG